MICKEMLALCQMEGGEAGMQAEQLCQSPFVPFEP